MEQTAESGQEITKADTSGMDFTFDKSDTTADEPESGETVELPETEDHENYNITAGGNYTLSSGDDGVHADTDLEVSGDTTVLNITKKSVLPLPQSP